MNQAQQNAAIALICRWKHRGSPGMADPTWKTWESPNGTRWHLPPCYTQDLNAMNQAEKVLTVEQRAEYRRQLVAIVGEAWLWHATACVRAEALLRTLNLWQE